MKIQVILASTRPGRLGDRVAKWVLATAQARSNFKVELIDLADFNLPHFNEPVSPRFNPRRDPAPNVKRWLDTVAAADGYVVVTPEYNHSIPGVLKDALDFADFQFVKKPFAIVSYGVVGGARAAEHLKGVILEVKAAVVSQAVALLGKVEELLDADGRPLTDLGSRQAALDTTLTELAWWTRTLAAGRSATSSSQPSADAQSNAPAPAVSGSK